MKAEVAKKFDIAPGAVTKFQDTEFGRIDLNTISLAQAEKLHAKRKGILIEKKESKKAES